MGGRGWLLVPVMMLSLATAPPAFAHAERVASTPDEGERLKGKPPTLQIDFSEPPIGDATFEVLDGCGRDVVADLEVQGTQITASLAGGQPGLWNVRTHVVSGIDGHATRDQWRFRVAGEQDCAAEPVPTGPAAADDGSDTGGFPLLAFAAGTTLVIIFALLLRRKTP